MKIQGKKSLNSKRLDMWCLTWITLKSAMLSLLLFSFVMIISASEAAALNAREIMEKVEDLDDGDNSSGEMEMILIDKRGNKRVRKIQAFGKDKGKDSLQLMFFLYPADVKDTGFLTYDYDDSSKDDDQWLYLPALRKTKRIASSDKDGSFMGSDLSYADMTSRNLDDYAFKIVKEGKVGENPVWIIESLPNPKAQKETGYTKSLLFVRKDIFFVVRGVHWIKKGKKLKYVDNKKVEKIDGVWIATETHVTTKKGKRTLHRTVLTQKNVRFNQDISFELFTKRRLEKGL